jgi:hypothetical protein
LFSQWVASADRAFQDYEIVVDLDEADLNVLSVLSDIVPNCALLARSGEQRIWIPPQIEDRRDEAIKTLKAHGYTARRLPADP